MAAYIVNRAIAVMADASAHDPTLNENQLQTMWIQQMRLGFGVAGGTVSRDPGKNVMANVINGANKN